MKAAKTRALHRHKGAAPVHHAAKAHKASSKAKKAAPAKKAHPKRTAAQVKAAHVRAWSPGGMSCCSAEAVAASLRLAGWPVPAAEVLALYRRTADGPEAGASLLVTLEAAATLGLAGVRPARFAPVDLDDPAAVILGLDMPEAPHAVALDPSGAVWSWGRLYDLTGDAVIAEAWAVEWRLA